MRERPRWIATVELVPHWKNYAILSDRFAQWEAKGVTKNAFTPANAARLSFGLAESFNPRVAKGDHTFWVDSIGIPMANGYLDRYTASVGEMIHYLYAFTNNYDGVNKWMLVDWP